MARLTPTWREWQDQVAELAQRHRWRVASFRPARTAKGWRTPVGHDGKGFPDLLLVRERVIAVECKTGRGRTDREQEAWLQAFERAGGIALVARPEDWDRLCALLR